MMIARSSVSVNVDDEPPAIPMGVYGGIGVFGFFASRFSFLGVVGDGVREFARGLLVLGRPDYVGVGMVVGVGDSVILAWVVFVYAVVEHG